MPPVAAAGSAAGGAAGGAAAGAAGKSASSAGKKAASSASKSGGNSLPNIDRHRNATNYLQGNENSAENGDEENADSSENINYTGSGRSSSAGSGFSSKFSGSGKGKVDLNKLKKAAPVLLLIGVFLVPLLLIFGTGSLLFADIDENTQESMDVQYTMMRKVAHIAVGKALANGSLPSPLADRMTDAGLEVGYLDTNGSFIAGLRPNSDTTFASTTTSDSISSNDSSLAVNLESEEKDNSLVIRFKNQIITSADWLNNFPEEDIEAYKAFKDATYGRAAGHYDDAADLFYSNINASRNVFASYEPDDTTDFREVLGAYYTNKADSAYEVKDSACPEVGGTPTPHINECSPTNQGHSDVITDYLNALYENTTIEADDSDLDNCPNNYKLEGHCMYDKAQAATIAYLVNNALNANETYESMKYFLTLAETMSKTKAGEGSSAPINEMLNYLTETDENGISAVQSPTLSSILTKSFGNYTTDDKTPYSIDRLQKIISERMDIITSDYLSIALGTTSLSWNGSASSSYGIKDDSLSIVKLADEMEEPVKPNDLDVYLSLCNVYDREEDPDSFNSCTETQTNAYNADMADYEREKAKYKKYFPKVCNPYDTSQSALDKLTTYGMTIDECKSYHNTTLDLLKELEKTLDFSDESKTTFLNDDGFNTLIGSDVGELFSKGASNLGYKIATTAQGGTIGTNESVVAYKKETDKILALDASADRLDRSPFDITSKNTFLGSIVHSLSSYLYTSPTITSTFSSFSSLLRSSFLNLLPGAFADSEEKTFQTIYGECPESTTYGDEFVCSVFSHPTVTFDVDSLENTINGLDSYLSSNIDASKKPTGDLEEFISYNNNRTSNVGYVNKNIAEEIEKKNPNFLARGVKQFKQFIKNKIFQFFNDAYRIDDYFSTYYARFTDDELEKVAGNAYINDGSADWDNNYKNAQAYCTLSRFLDQAGYFSVENTNKTAFNDYFIPGTGENPYIIALKESSTDFSTLNDTEYLAAISGMSEKEANIVLGYVAYNSYLASIDYETRLAFGREEKFNFEDSIQFEEIDPIKTELAILAKNDSQKLLRKDPVYVA